MYVQFSTPTSVVSTQNAKGIAKKRQCGKTGKSVSFTSAASVSRDLAAQGIKTEFLNNDFYARCAEQAVDLFKCLFGKSSLPKSIVYCPMCTDRWQGIQYGEYSTYYREARFNSALTEMSSMDGLRKLAKSAHHYILPNDFASLHPASTHVHEFAHSAHHAHLDKIHGGNGSDIMISKLRQTKVPTAIGRLITRYKLGNYATGKQGGMNEFMAERITQDVCNDLSETFWYPHRNADVEYSDIFSRKWKYRYSCPQAYLDYFTQQVWNGDIEEAKRAGKMAEEYLAEIDYVKVPESIGTMTEKASEKGGFVSKLMSGISGLFENITVGLDKRNELMLKY